MKQGKIYLYDQYVGLLTEDETGFTLAYNSDYLASNGAEAVNPRRMAAEYRRKQLENQPARQNVAPPCLLQGLHRSRQRNSSR